MCFFIAAMALGFASLLCLELGLATRPPRGLRVYPQWGPIRSGACLGGLEESLGGLREASRGSIFRASHGIAGEKKRLALSTPRGQRQLEDFRVYFQTGQ